MSMPVGGGGGGSGSGGGGVSRSVAALIRLLQLAGVSCRPGAGWSYPLWHSLLYVLLSAAAWLSVVLLARVGLAMLSDGKHWVTATLMSGFFGLTAVLTWLTLTITFVWGRRRYAALMSNLLEAMEEMDALAALSGGRGGRSGRVRRHLRLLWAVTIVYPVATLMSLYLQIPASACASLTPACAVILLRDVMTCLLLSWFQLVPLKFILAGVLLHDCLQSLNGHLLPVGSIEAWPGSEGLLSRLERLQRRLSGLLAQLTEAMVVELVVPTLYGVLAVIDTLMLLVHMLSRLGVSPGSVMFVMVHAVSVVLMLVGPCETCQRLLGDLGVSRDLLLQLELQLGERPVPARQVALMRAAASRDLDTFGDLGLFRLRRSTLLGIVSTTVTYIIVIAQFLVSSDGGWLVKNDETLENSV